MADKRIVDLPVADTLVGDEIVALVQAGETRRASLDRISIVVGGSGGGGPSVSLSNDTPIMDQGTGAAGTGTEAARWNHVHPIDTSRASLQGLQAVENRVLALEQNGGGGGATEAALAVERQRIDALVQQVEQIGDTAAAQGQAQVATNDKLNEFDAAIAQVTNIANSALTAATSLPQRSLVVVGASMNPYITTASDAGKVLLWTGAGQLVVSLSQLTPGTEIEMIAADNNSIRIDPGSGSNLFSAKIPITIGRGSRARALRISEQTWVVDGDLVPKDDTPGITNRFVSEDGNTFMTEDGTQYYQQESA